MKVTMIIMTNQCQKHDGGGGILNNNSGTGAYKFITIIIDVMVDK